MRITEVMAKLNLFRPEDKQILEQLWAEAYDKGIAAAGAMIDGAPCGIDEVAYYQ